MQKERLIHYETDASLIKGRAKDVMHPESISEMQRIIRQEKRICIRGGGTGLTGGAVPEQGQDIVLDTSKLIKIENIDLDRKTIEVEAGVILQDLQDYLKKFNLEFPIQPQSKDTCTIGGMIATNASDSRILKYKDTKQWVRWIEVIDGQGTIDRKGKTEISDYAGLEGITGVISKACLNLINIPKTYSGTLLKIESKEKIIDTVSRRKQQDGVIAIDFLDKIISEGIGLSKDYHILIEHEDDSGTLRDKAYSTLITKKENIYKFLMSEGYTKMEDVKIMINRFTEIVTWLEQRNIPVYANISVGLVYAHFYKGQEKHIEEFYKLVQRSGGQVSGRHGIGITKKRYIEPQDKKILENIKKRTDPANKFNTGKVL